MPKKIIIICYSDLAREPRLLKEIQALKNHYEVICAGLKSPSIEGVKFIQLERKRYRHSTASISFHLKLHVPLRKFFSFVIQLYLKITKYKEKQWLNYAEDDYNLLSKIDASVIIAHHLETLPLAFALKSATSKIVFSAHEYYPLEFDNEAFNANIKPRYDFLCRKYLSNCALVFNSCHSFAEKYKENFRVDSVIFENTPPYQDLMVQPTISYPIKLVHHGIAIPERHIEQFIYTMKNLNKDFSLDLILVNIDNAYLNKLKDLCAGVKTVRILNPVPYHEIPNCLNKYDIGICYLPNNSFNNIYSLPNKLFDYIQARLAVITAPSFEVARFVEDKQIGFVSENFSAKSLAQVIQELEMDKINICKLRSDKIARIYSAENTHEVIRNAIKNLTI